MYSKIIRKNSLIYLECIRKGRTFAPAFLVRCFAACFRTFLKGIRCYNFGSDTEGSPAKVHDAVDYMQKEYPELAIDGDNTATSREIIRMTEAVPTFRITRHYADEVEALYTQLLPLLLQHDGVFLYPASRFIPMPHESLPTPRAEQTIPVKTTLQHHSTPHANNDQHYTE